MFLDKLLGKLAGNTADAAAYTY